MPEKEVPEEEKQGEPGKDGPPLKENAGGGQYYFPGRERGCLSVLLVIAVLAVAWSTAG